MKPTVNFLQNDSVIQGTSALVVAAE